MSMAGFRSETCIVCGHGFMDDCGDVFCSSSCERTYERENAREKCVKCEDEFHPDELYRGMCESCEEVISEMDGDL